MSEHNNVMTAQPELLPTGKSERIAHLGELLIEQNIISRLQLDFVLQKQKVEQERLGQMLIKHGLAQEYEIARVLAHKHKLEQVDANRVPAPDNEALKPFNRELCLTHGFLPLRRIGNTLEVLLGDGTPQVVDELIARRTGLSATYLQGEFSKVARLIRQIFFFAQNPIEELLTKEVARLSSDVDHAYNPERALAHLLHLAVRERATDIHISPSESSLHVLLRVDGVLRPQLALPSVLGRLISYVKLNSEMDVSEQRLPQDGSFQATVLDSSYTVRVSTLISEFGERMVLRILPERSELSGLEQLGFLTRDVDVLKRLFAKPAGLILITGPTGSGKSTTLHSALRMQSLIERNVLTIEDPVEYRVPGACQTEVNRRAGYDFSTAMRHFLRHDPDVMLVGEIRDNETAQSAIDAASTGHLVLSTLHVGSVFGVFSRLKLLGVDADSIAENLLAVVNQRLVRQICPFCTVEAPLTNEERHWLGLDAPERGLLGEGCDRCGETGYYGRIPVYELLLVDRMLANAIVDGAPRSKLEAVALSNGFRSIKEEARYRVREGHTTVAEIFRAVGQELV